MEAERARRSDPRATGLLVGGAFGLLAALAVAFTIYAMQRWWFPPVASQLGRQIDDLFMIIWVTIGVIFILVNVALAYILMRFGGNPRASYWHDDRRLELTWTLVPAVGLTIFTILGAGLWLRAQEIGPWGRVTFPPGQQVLLVQVRGEQFGWRARYPGPDGQFGRINPGLITAQNPWGLDPADPASRDDVVTLNDVRVVVDRPVEIRLFSRDVIHSFYLPHMRVKQDAVPGLGTRVTFTPTQTGEYPLMCAELCGVGHYIMKGNVIVQSQQAFDAWLAGQARRP